MGVNVKTLFEVARIVPLTSGLMVNAARTALSVTGRSNRMTMAAVSLMRLPLSNEPAILAVVATRTLGAVGATLVPGLPVACGPATVSRAG